MLEENFLQNCDQGLLLIMTVILMQSMLKLNQQILSFHFTVI